ncbi:MAG: uL15 family ribosomal protein [Clostridia bacterium]|nr:uL15 family ribosomal protein [Clostridia bacterium]
MDIVSIIVAIIEVIAAIAVIVFAVEVFSGCFSGKKKVEEPEKEEEPAPVPMPEPEPEQEEPAEEPHLPEFVDHINAIEADEMLSDEVALAFVIEEDEDESDDDDDNAVVLPKAEDGPKTEGKRGFINIGDIDVAFEAHEHITLDALKQKGLMPNKIKRVKILADGELTKPLTVKAHSFSIQAIKMIELTGGTVIRIR